MSILSHKHRFLFVHVAKTGGRSIGIALRKHCLSTERFNTHSLDPNVDMLGRRIALEVRPALTDEQWDDYFKFAFVRNPWDRTVSMYHHIKSSVSLKATGKIRYLEEITRRLKIHPDELTFDVFVRRVLQDRVFDNYHWDKQIRCFTDEGNTNVFDFIGRFEHLQRDYNAVCERLGLPIERLPYQNRTRHLHYSSYYDSQTEQIVADLYPEDIRMFGYGFERVVGKEKVEINRPSKVKCVSWRVATTGKRLWRALRSQVTGQLKPVWIAATGRQPHDRESVIRRLKAGR